MHRRQFLRGSAFVSGLGLAGAHVARAQGSTQLNTVLIGTGWWGMNIARVAMASGRCKLVALCDVDRNQLTPAAAEIERLSGAKPRLYGDFRELFAREKPAIEIVATADH